MYILYFSYIFYYVYFIYFLHFFIIYILYFSYIFYYAKNSIKIRFQMPTAKNGIQIHYLHPKKTYISKIKVATLFFNANLLEKNPFCGVD